MKQTQFIRFIVSKSKPVATLPGGVFEFLAKILILYYILHFCFLSNFYQSQINKYRPGEPQLTASEQAASDKSNRNDNICFALIVSIFQVFWPGYWNLVVSRLYVK